MNKISQIHARRVWDSRGRPTIEVEITLENGRSGRAIAPSGASRGSREAIDLRDGGKKLGGYDVQKAIANVKGPIARALLGQDVSDITVNDAILQALDPSPTKSILGGNAIVATSLALLHAAAVDAALPLWRFVSLYYDRKVSIPLPEIQIFGGGAHASRRVDLQDFMVMVPGAESFAEALEVTAEIYIQAGRLMEARGPLVGAADEGGWWPNFTSNEDALDVLTRAVENAGETPGERVVISLDIAASEFGKDGEYRLSADNLSLSREEWLEKLSGWCGKYAIASIEDPMAEDDLIGMTVFTKAWGDRLQIIGDDYVVSNAALIEAAGREMACNSALIKVNQIGTVSEAFKAIEASEAQNWSTIVSARSGESEDVSVAHLAIGWGAGQLKVGSITRGERTAKWNEVLRIEEILGQDKFVHARALAPTPAYKNRTQGN